MMARWAGLWTSRAPQCTIFVHPQLNTLTSSLHQLVNNNLRRASRCSPSQVLQATRTMCSTRELRWIAFFLLAASGSSFSTPSRTLSRQNPVVHPFRSNGPLRALFDSRLDGDTNEMLVEDRSLMETAIIYSFPVATAVTSFTLYEQISKTFHGVVQVLSKNKWIPVDGGELVANIIIPAINGPVLSSIGLLFATLVATTIGNLYNRQTQISRSIIRELEDLRRMGFLLESLPNPYRRKGQAELNDYCDYLFNAAKAGTISAETYRKKDLNALFLLLNKISTASETNDSVVVPGAVLGEAYELVRRLDDHRTTLRSLLASGFPPLHFVTLISLGSSICLIFLIETDRDLMFFLAGFQLRILWSMLIGTFAMMAAVIYDLANPFGGSYNVVNMSDQQLQSIKQYVSESWED